MTNPNPPRKGEIDGEDYLFLTREDFKKRRDNDEFIEWAEVHDNLYGTLITELDRCLESGADVVLELDVLRLGALVFSPVWPGLVPPGSVLGALVRRRAGVSGDTLAAYTGFSSGALGVAGLSGGFLPATLN